MKRYEYRIESLNCSLWRPSEDQVLEALNRFGQEGWRLNRIQGILGTFKLFLERELTDGA